MILIVLQLLSIFAAMILLGWEAYYILGFVSAIFLVVTEFNLWKRGIKEKFRDSDLISIDVETSTHISLWFTVFFNCIIVFVAWPAVMLSKFFSGFAPPPPPKENEES